MNLMNHLFQQMKINLLLNENHHLQKTFSTEGKKNRLNFLFISLKLLNLPNKKRSKISSLYSTIFLLYLFHIMEATIPKAYFFFSLDGIELKYYPLWKEEFWFAWNIFVSYRIVWYLEENMYITHSIIWLKCVFLFFLEFDLTFFYALLNHKYFEYNFLMWKSTSLEYIFFYFWGKFNLPFVK